MTKLTEPMLELRSHLPRASLVRRGPMRWYSHVPERCQARHEQMVGLVERMLKLHAKSRTLPADSLRLAAPDGCSIRNTSEPLAVSRRPIANTRQIAATDKQLDELVYELYSLTKDEIRIVEVGSGV